MAETVKVAIVTGSNRGIGNAIVKALSKSFEGVVYLTSRDENSGKAAVQELESQGLKVNFHQLDIANLDSVKKFAIYIKEKYNGLDLLINNAGFAYPGKTDVPVSKQALDSIEINYKGTLNMCDEFFPLLRPHARVVHVSSRVGMLKVCKNPDFRTKLTSEDLTIEEITTLMDKFIEAAQNGTSESISTSCYGFAKCGVTAATRVQQRAFDKDPRPDIIVNACCPGLVATGMSGNRGKPVDEGAITPLFLATVPMTGPKGELWAEKERVEWTNLEWQWPQAAIDAFTKSNNQ